MKARFAGALLALLLTAACGTQEAPSSVTVTPVDAMPGGAVEVTTAPAAGVAITAGFEFDVPVRFDTDEMNISMMEGDFFNWTSIPLVELRGSGI